MYRVPRESVWVSVGVPSAARQCAEAGVALGPSCHACDADLLRAPVGISTCLPPPLSGLTVILTYSSVNKVCALFVTASTLCFLSGFLAPFKGLSHLKKCQRTSLVTQWLRIHLPVQGTWVQSLVQEDLTCQDN